MYTARFTGPRWIVAMTGETWLKFAQVPETANIRLTAMLDLLAQRGEEDFPGRSFRWVGTAGGQMARNVEIEACGVVLMGHVSPAEGREQLFITKIRVDEAEEGSLPQRRKKAAFDSRQGILRFDDNGENARD